MPSPAITTSTRQFFLDLAANHEPESIFRGSSAADFEKWRATFSSQFKSCLGPLPEKIPLQVERLWKVEEDGLRKEKILLKTAPYTWVPALVLAPAQGKPRGAVVAIHGHGKFGKDPVGGAGYPEAQTAAKELNYAYGLQLAQAGYLTICPDMRPFGERGDNMPGERPLFDDPCNVHAIKAWLLGFNLLTYNLWDLMRCVDYLLEFEEADPSRLGAIGLSGGGCGAMHFGALDARLSAVAVICALNSYQAWAIGIDNFCGTQFLPGMFRYGDHAEICGLIAPRHLFIQLGGFDYGFPVAASMEALARLKTIYKSAGAAEKLVTSINYGGHQYYGGGPEFFTQAFSGSR